MHEGNKNKRLELEMDRVITKLINCNYIRIKKKQNTHISDPHSENTKRKGVSQLELDGELKALLTLK